jgi:hypothetical protein
MLKSFISAAVALLVSVSVAHAADSKPAKPEAAPAMHHTAKHAAKHTSAKYGAVRSKHARHYASKHAHQKHVASARGPKIPSHASAKHVVSKSSGMKHYASRHSHQKHLAARPSHEPCKGTYMYFKGGKCLDARLKTSA